VEWDLTSKMFELKIFEKLCCEKLSPLFLNLTKKRAGAGLEKIIKPDGTAFANDEEREQFIFNTFSWPRIEYHYRRTPYSTF
jgi:hypothetical protein